MVMSKNILESDARMIKNVKSICCICKRTIEKGDFDPCSLVLIANSENEWREQKEQTFFCHMDCFRKTVNDDGIMYIIEPDFPTNGEIEDEEL
jgi:hypothetical protein